MKKADNFNTKKWLTENKITTQSRLNEANQDFKIISKKTEKSEYSDQVFDTYRIELLDEDYTTPDGLTFHLKTIATVMTPEGEELNPTSPGQGFIYIWTDVFDENGNKLENIPGEMRYGTYNRAGSINKAKKMVKPKRFPTYVR